MMTTHVASVVACWLIGLIGLAMLVRAKTWRGQAAAHGSVVLAMLLLSAMALDHDHLPPRAAALPALSPVLYVGTVGDKPEDQIYHAGGCPIPSHHDVIFGSQQEAVRAGKFPCTYCLLQYAQHEPEHQGQQHSHSNTGE